MDTALKTALLEQLYRIYDKFAGNLDVACQKHCDQCCSCNVTMTSLEGYVIVDYLISQGRTDLFGKLRAESLKKRFKPEITTNGLADLCIRGDDIPDEKIDPKWGKCPLLAESVCPVYQVRSFGCRCFVSEKDCRITGYADVDPFVITVNNLFLQYIENIDSQGCSGNLTDILLSLESSKTRQIYRTGMLRKNNGLIPNRPIPALMIPPEHRLKIQPMLNSIHTAASSI